MPLDQKKTTNVANIILKLKHEPTAILEFIDMIPDFDFNLFVKTQLELKMKAPTLIHEILSDNKSENASAMTLLLKKINQTLRPTSTNEEKEEKKVRQDTTGVLDNIATLVDAHGTNLFQVISQSKWADTETYSQFISMVSDTTLNVAILALDQGYLGFNSIMTNTNEIFAAILQRLTPATVSLAIQTQGAQNFVDLARSGTHEKFLAVVTKIPSTNFSNLMLTLNYDEPVFQRIVATGNSRNFLALLNRLPAYVINVATTTQNKHGSTGFREVAVHQDSTSFEAYLAKLPTRTLNTALEIVTKEEVRYENPNGLQAVACYQTSQHFMQILEKMDPFKLAEYNDNDNLNHQLAYNTRINQNEKKQARKAISNIYSYLNYACKIGDFIKFANKHIIISDEKIPSLEKWIVTIETYILALELERATIYEKISNRDLWAAPRSKTPSLTSQHINDALVKLACRAYVCLDNQATTYQPDMQRKLYQNLLKTSPLYRGDNDIIGEYLTVFGSPFANAENSESFLTAISGLELQLATDNYVNIYKKGLMHLNMATEAGNEYAQRLLQRQLFSFDLEKQEPATLRSATEQHFDAIQKKLQERIDQLHAKDWNKVTKQMKIAAKNFANNEFLHTFAIYKIQYECKKTDSMQERKLLKHMQHLIQHELENTKPLSMQYGFFKINYYSWLQETKHVLEKIMAQQKKPEHQHTGHISAKL